MPLKTSLLLALLLALTSCRGDLYDPCKTVEDCDPLIADGRFTARTRARARVYHRLPAGHRLPIRP